MNLFEDVRLLVIPVNLSNHWSVVLVHMQPYRVDAYHLDSLCIHKENKSVVRTIRKYLRHERDRLNTYDRINLDYDSPIHDVSTPGQQNGYDCGMYVCANFKKTLDLFGNAVKKIKTERKTEDKENFIPPTRIISLVLSQWKEKSDSYALEYPSSYVSQMRHDLEALITRLVSEPTKKDQTTTKRRKRRKKKK